MTFELSSQTLLQMFSAIKSATIYYQGPAPAVNFIVDETSVQSTSPSGASPNVDDAINRLRKSDMHFQSRDFHFSLLALAFLSHSR